MLNENDVECFYTHINMLYNKMQMFINELLPIAIILKKKYIVQDNINCLLPYKIGVSMFNLVSIISKCS